MASSLLALVSSSGILAAGNGSRSILARILVGIEDLWIRVCI